MNPPLVCSKNKVCVVVKHAISKKQSVLKLNQFRANNVDAMGFVQGISMQHTAALANGKFKVALLGELCAHLWSASHVSLGLLCQVLFALAWMGLCSLTFLRFSSCTWLWSLAFPS